jgi:plastocyanin
MANHRVQLILDASGSLSWDPNPVRVNPGDTVQWTSATGDVAVSFDISKNPFTVHKDFTAARGGTTELARVRDDVHVPDHFDCTVTLGGRKFFNTSGVDTPGPGN